MLFYIITSSVEGFHILDSTSVRFTQSCPTLCNPMDCIHKGPLSITKSQSLLKLMSLDSAVPSNHLIPCRPLLLLPSIFPSIRVFSNVSSSLQVAKYWSFSLGISPSNEYLGLISFKDCLVGSPCRPRDSQESSPTPQFKASILWCSAFFIVQLSHPYMTTRKTIALTRWTFVAKCCLCFLICCLGWS